MHVNERQVTAYPRKDTYVINNFLFQYTSKCPDWNSCSIYTKKELSTMYFNSKYCMNIVPDKVVGNRFGSGQVRDLCLDRGLAIVQFSGAPKEDEPEEISNCLADYFGMSVVAPTYTCLQQALAKDISEMEQVSFPTQSCLLRKHSLFRLKDC